MQPTTQVIAVKALMGGRPVVEWGEENFSRWEFKFQLSPVPEKAWRNHFSRVVAEWLDSATKKEAAAAALNQTKEKDEAWSFELNSETPDVVVGTCSPDDLKFFLIKLKSLVKRANEGHAESVRNRQKGEQYKAAFLKEIEKLKKTLDFNN